MTIGFVASAEREAKREEMVCLLMQYVLEHSEGHDLLIEPRFYASLLRLGLDMKNARSISPMSEGASCDLIVSIGGDGTFLRAAKLVAGTAAAILGVNAGRLGFLASIQPGDMMTSWGNILQGACDLDRRSMLAIYEVQEETKETLIGEAFNEISLVRRDTASMIEVETHVNGEYMAAYVGDGVIVATPSGSTAYSMSVQGPIIDPSSRVHLICPIAPHSLNMRPLVLPDDAELTLEVTSRNGSFLLAVDGKGKPMIHHTLLKIRKSPNEVSIAHVAGANSYYSTLRNKLMWGRDVRKG